MAGFRLCEGVFAENTRGLESSFCVEGSNVNGLLSAELIGACAEGFIRLLDEPVFFFLELPREGSEEYDVYYLDNCTAKVALAIMKRYGVLLINDGLARFGFGSHKTDEEIYFTDFQEFCIYTKNVPGVKKLLTSLGAKQKDKPDSVWALLSDDNEGSLSSVEAEGETVFDIPIALSSEGMAKSE